jgi:formyltetrahydrofolate synthetase
MTSALPFGADDIMTMPGLHKVPSATNIRMNANGHIEGLF